jgi:hypothetical protein
MFRWRRHINSTAERHDHIAVLIQFFDQYGSFGNSDRDREIGGGKCNWRVGDFSRWLDEPVGRGTEQFRAGNLYQYYVRCRNT